MKAPNSPDSERKETSNGLLLLDIGIHEIVFDVDRDDLTLGDAVFTASCFQRVSQEQAEQDTHTDCDLFRVDGVEHPRSYRSATLEPTGLNTFRLAATRIEFSVAHEAYICLAVKPWFNEIPNEYDWFYYAEGADRYSMLSYCSVAEIPDWGWDNARVTQNRVQTLDEFERRLGVPIGIPTSDRALPERLGSGKFKGSDLRSGELRQCGHAVPMPAGRIPEDQSSEPIKIPVGIYLGWLFDDTKTYQCEEE